MGSSLATNSKIPHSQGPSQEGVGELTVSGHTGATGRSESYPIPSCLGPSVTPGGLPGQGSFGEGLEQAQEPPWGWGRGLSGGAGAKPLPSLLVSEHKTVTDSGVDSSAETKAARAARARRRRCFHRVMSGLERGGSLRVVMLSSGVTDKAVVQRAFRSLVAWAKRRGLLDAYFRVPELTEEGYIHLHLVFRGSFMDRLLLMKVWYRFLGGAEYMPGAKYVYLQRLHSKRGVAHYLAKYMVKGEGYSWLRGNYSWSWGWVWRGFCRDWDALKRLWRYAVEVKGFSMSYGRLLALWRWHCAVGIPLALDTWLEAARSEGQAWRLSRGLVAQSG